MKSEFEFESALLRDLLITTSSDSQAHICRTLGERLPTDPVAVLDGLVEALQNRSESVRQEAAVAIGRIFGYFENPPVQLIPAARAALMERLARESGAGTVSSLLSSLGFTGDSGTVEAIRPYVSHSDGRVSRQARQAIDRIESSSRDSPRLFEARLRGEWRGGDDVIGFMPDKALTGVATFAETGLMPVQLSGFWDQPTLSTVVLELDLPEPSTDFVYVTLLVRGRDSDAELVYQEPSGSEKVFVPSGAGTTNRGPRV